ncbi:hypothetical protein B9Z55_012708 [Caenorhabditis nigoni]|uniref:SoHo domain-containing protein n=1 Tax=Caenorhabditis nigoni TaxID=1611254 RepID=A0A2G5TYF4_9PELO|nr:hypothetical protein B9Z55_012708 [Caenorhabditis nigoni]
MLDFQTFFYSKESPGNIWKASLARRLTPEVAGGDRSISDTYPVSSVVSSPPMDPTTTQTNKEPNETMSNSMSTNMDDSIVIHKHESPDSSPDRHEDMSQWYRKMFKQMHKKGDEEQPKTTEEFERFAKFFETNRNSEFENEETTLLNSEIGDVR